MKTKLIPNIIVVILMLASSVFITGCDKDDSNDGPANAVTLNVLDELNGKTQIGTSDVYINKSYNFRASSNFISDAGKASGLGAVDEPQTNNLVREVAVIPGHIYQIFDRMSLREFPSGNSAIQLNASYYQVYTTSTIVNDNFIIGAVIQYASVYPDPKGLPAFGSVIGTVDYQTNEIEVNIPKNAECFYEDELAKLFDISATGGKLKMTLVSPIYEEEDYYIYIRLGGIYTAVAVELRYNR